MIASLISIVIVAAVTTIGTKVGGMFTSVSTNLP
jgi:Flp pilus assembly pilin Flp